MALYGSQGEDVTGDWSGSEMRGQRGYFTPKITFGNFYRVKRYVKLHDTELYYAISLARHLTELKSDQRSYKTLLFVGVSLKKKLTFDFHPLSKSIEPRPRQRCNLRF